MIKLFFITLLCVTLVFAESPLENFRNVRALDKPMTGLHAKLVRRSAHACGEGTGGMMEQEGMAAAMKAMERMAGGGGSAGGSAGAGGQAGLGFGVNGNAGFGGGAGAGK
ncbi:glycine-rich protein 5-like isoform X1 [Camponotus floridanus]|nr:glycine-rich protein 5-like isoform X1 [Camponotus floridanus]